MARATSSRHLVVSLLAAALVVLGAGGAQLAVPLPGLSTAGAAPAAVAATGSITLAVNELVLPLGSPVGPAITTYRWMVNHENTGDPGTASRQLLDSCLPDSAKATTVPSATDPSSAVGHALAGADLASTCPWPSVRGNDGSAAIEAQGTEADLGPTTPIVLPNGSYLISLLADGYKIDGAHVTVNGDTQRVQATMHPTPLPLTTLRIQVYQDSVPVDATYEADAEDPIEGFTAHLSDVFGDVSVDYYGNALCTKYRHVNPDGTGAIVFTNGKPVVDPTSIGRCVSDVTGEIVIPNMGPDRYAARVTPPAVPAGQTWKWVQTTSLEGGHDHDMWFAEGETGYDNEVTKGGEPVPMVQFGYVRSDTNTLPKAPAAIPSGVVSGQVNAVLPYIGGVNGLPGPTEGLPAGSKLGAPISKPWVALSDLNGGDRAVWVGRGDATGRFRIEGVPDGSYQLTAWDDDQDYILATWNVEVDHGATVDVGVKTLMGWFSHIQGTVFIDTNGNGKRDPGEQGVPQFPLTVHERDNSLMDQGTNAVSTDTGGHYDIAEVYPLGKFLVLEAFDTRYTTTGITYQADNDPRPTTRLGSLVDITFLPIIGLGGTIDWGVRPYVGTENGGIAGTVTYDTTRNELDPQDAATESYQPGIPHLPVHLYAPVKCTTTDPALAANVCKQGYQINPIYSDPVNKVLSTEPDAGQMVRSPELDTTTTESFEAPSGCTARMYNGQPLTDQQALPEFGNPAVHCVEAPMAATEIGPTDQTAGDASQTVNGNYGFSSSTLNLYPPGNAKNPAPDRQLPLYANLADNGYGPQDLPPADYIVTVDIPDNPSGSGPMYKVTAEDSINVFDGDTYVPQDGWVDQTDPAATTPDGGTGLVPTPPSQPVSQQAGYISGCVGTYHTVHVTNENFLANGGSPFEGMARPSCQDKLVTVRAGQTMAPNFSLFTDVPLPTHFWGLTLNDLGLSLDKRSVNYGEAEGMPYVPVGLYDWSGKLAATTHTDFNGLYEALVPSTGTYNCPVPAGPCPNIYRFVGNDPGAPGALNPDYNPRYRTIAANFQAWPGLYTVTDEAPTQVAATVLTPDGKPANNTVCNLPATVPQLLSVDRPVVSLASANRTVVVKGTGFGGSGTIRLGGTRVSQVAWTDTQITFSVPATMPTGARTIDITSASNGPLLYNRLTLQVVSGAGDAGATVGNPKVFEVGPTAGRFATIQSAIDAAQAAMVAPSPSTYNLVVVYPGAPSALLPRGEYLENVIVDSRIHIQGAGPGGFQGTTWVPGTIIDGSGFNIDNAIGLGWLTTLSGLAYTGAPAVPDASVVTFLNPRVSPDAMAASWRPSLDGFQITGGIQSDNTTNVNLLTGGIKTPYGAAGALVTQGGGIYLHNQVVGASLTDNLIVGNGGTYGGGVRVGTPYVDIAGSPASPTSVSDSGNTGVVISHNQVRDNGGTNLAGGIGIFAGSNGYSVDHNAICGNHSSEYGGGVTAFGFMGSGSSTNGAVVTTTSPVADYARYGGGSIAGNRIWFNQSYDEGGGVMVAGELPADPTVLSQGAGPVSIDANVIQANLANDDGGGIRLLQVSGQHLTRKQAGFVSITNDTIADNVSTHEGGGIAIDDAAFVNVVGTTVVKNITTATAMTSNGLPVAAGLTTGTISDALQARIDAQFGQTALLAGKRVLSNSLLVSKAASVYLGYAKPSIVDSVFWDNRAGTYEGGVVKGIGAVLPGTAAPDTINYSDMEVVDQATRAVAPMRLSPVGSVFQSLTAPDPLRTVTVDNPTAAHNRVVTDVNPGLIAPYDVGVNVLALRANPQFRQAAIVTAVLPFDLMGNYHLTGPAAVPYGAGVDHARIEWGNPVVGNSFDYDVNATRLDIDAQPRPSRSVTGGDRWDAGSDQLP